MGRDLSNNSGVGRGDLVGDFVLGSRFARAISFARCARRYAFGVLCARRAVFHWRGIMGGVGLVARAANSDDSAFASCGRGELRGPLLSGAVVAERPRPLGRAVDGARFSCWAAFIMDLWARLKAIYWALPSRCACRAPLWWNLAKTLGQSVVMWTAFLVIAPFVFWQIESWLLQNGWQLQRFVPLRIGAMILFVLGWSIAWASAWVLVKWGRGTPLPLDATNELVIRGPYRWIANPMATSSLLQGAAIGLWFGSPLILVYVAAGALLWNTAARPWEEADLCARFGEKYERYRRSVRCWWPRFSAYDGAED